MLMALPHRNSISCQKPRWTIEVNLPQNLFVIRYSGRVGPDHIKECAKEVKIALAGVQPGFRLLVDLTDLESMDVSCVTEIRSIMKVCNQKGVSEVVRVIPDPKQDIGLQIMSYFHYRGDVHITTCASAAEATAALSN